MMATSPMRSSRSTGVTSAIGSRTSSSLRSSIRAVTSTAGVSGGVSWEMSPSVTCGITVIVAFSRAGRPRSSSSTSTSGLSIGSIDLSRIACCSTSGTIVSTTSSRRAAGPMRASISWRGARPGRKPSIFARDARRFSTRSYVASTSSAGTSMVMPTWLLGNVSVTTDSAEGIGRILRTAECRYCF